MVKKINEEVKKTCKSFNLIPAAIETKMWSFDTNGFSSRSTFLTTKYKTDADSDFRFRITKK